MIHIQVVQSCITSVALQAISDINQVKGLYLPRKSASCRKKVIPQRMLSWAEFLPVSLAPSPAIGGSLGPAPPSSTPLPSVPP